MSTATKIKLAKVTTASPPAQPPAPPDFTADRAEGAENAETARRFEAVLGDHLPKGSYLAAVTASLMQHSVALVALADVLRASQFHTDRAQDGDTSEGSGLGGFTFYGLMAAQQLLSTGVMDLSDDLNNYLQREARAEASK
ncbi:hypothetical protein [Roseateles sp.]|uniref:hypothetical protein n=1 Tax=Roseateles sp. TaxID=1971397 RepID=UPI003BAA66F5